LILTSANWKYCSTEILVPKKSFKSLTNQDLRQYMCPQSVDKCDANVEVKINSATEYAMRSKQWDFEVPTTDATDWNCKYRLFLDTASGLPSANNFIMVQVEAYGFEETLTVMSQPAGGFNKKIEDFLGNNNANGVRVY